MVVLLAATTVELSEVGVAVNKSKVAVVDERLALVNAANGAVVDRKELLED